MKAVRPTNIGLPDLIPLRIAQHWDTFPRLLGTRVALMAGMDSGPAEEVSASSIRRRISKPHTLAPFLGAPFPIFRSPQREVMTDTWFARGMAASNLSGVPPLRLL